MRIFGHMQNHKLLKRKDLYINGINFIYHNGLKTIK